MSTHPSDSAEPTGNENQKITVTAVRQMIISTTIMALVLVSMTQAFVIMRNSEQVTQTEKTRYNSYLLADELRQTSDDLTRMVRTYSQTGDNRYIDYFEEILDIRNGIAPRPEKYHNIYWDYVISTGTPPRASTTPVALRELIEEAGFTNDELDLLEIAESTSNALVSLEIKAMNAMLGLYKDASGNYTVRGNPDPALARRLLYSNEYHQAKEQVMYPLEKFFDMADERTTRQIKQFERREEILVFSLIGTTSFAGLLSIVSIIMMAGSARKI